MSGCFVPSLCLSFLNPKMRPTRGTLRSIFMCQCPWSLEFLEDRNVWHHHSHADKAKEIPLFIKLVRGGASCVWLKGILPSKLSFFCSNFYCPTFHAKLQSSCEKNSRGEGFWVVIHVGVGFASDAPDFESSKILYGHVPSPIFCK